MAGMPDLLRDHVTLEVEFPDRLYLMATSVHWPPPGGLVIFLQEQLGKPMASPFLVGD